MIVTVVISAFAFTKINSKVYTVDSGKTKATWTGTKITGKHIGNIAVSKGEINSDGKVITGGKIEFDMNAITCTDLTDKGYNEKLIGHLKGEDFFNSAKFPISVFEITSVKHKAEENYDVTGKLTIKGITNEVTFPAVIKISESTIITVAKITVNRTKYDIKYGSASFVEGIGDKAISDDFELDVDVVALNK